MNKQLSGSIALTKLKHVLKTLKTKDNREIKGIFIPLEANHLVPGKENAWYLPVRILLRPQPDDYGQDGFISQSVDSKKWKEASDQEKEEFRNLPILGNVKDFTHAADTAGAMPDDYVEDPPEEKSDDLPF